MHDKTFLNFFELREAPFKANLDPRFLFVTPQLEKAFSQLMDAIHHGNCFAVITGEVGTGKTTFMHHLRRQLVQQALPTAFLFYPHLDGVQLLDFMLADFGIPSNSGETIDGWKYLENWLVEQHRGGQTPVLLVDEAQGLPRSAFDEIRRLLNLGSTRKRLLHVVLAGELELDEKLNRIRMRELQKRITTRCQTAALTRAETFDYVRARLRVSGADSQSLFEYDAVDAIYFHSHGIPRVISILCERALIEAFANQVHVVTPQLVQEVTRDFEWKAASHPRATESPVNLATVDAAEAALVPEILAPALSHAAGQALGVDEQPALSPLFSSIEAEAVSLEAPLKHPTRSPILLDPPAISVQQGLADIALGISDTAMGLANSAMETVRHLLAKLIQELKKQTRFGHFPVPAKMRGQESEQYSIGTHSAKINHRPARQRWSKSPFWAWWFYGSRPSWWNQIEVVANFQPWRFRSTSPFWAWWFYGLRPSPKWRTEDAVIANSPRWQRRYASLQRWLNEPVYPFQRDFGKSRSANTKRGLPEKSM
jgi:type II secretory pathway predicted ATPase ExeA